MSRYLRIPPGALSLPTPQATTKKPPPPRRPPIHTQVACLSLEMSMHCLRMLQAGASDDELSHASGMSPEACRHIRDAWTRIASDPEVDWPRLPRHGALSRFFSHLVRRLLPRQIDGADAGSTLVGALLRHGPLDEATISKTQALLIATMPTLRARAGTRTQPPASTSVYWPDFGGEALIALHGRSVLACALVLSLAVRSSRGA